MLLVSNGTLAASLIESMHNFFSKPDIHAICFQYGDTGAAKTALNQYFSERLASKDKSFIILCDMFGNTAFNETVLLLHELGIQEHALMICGMNLPMVFKLYGLKDYSNLELCRAIYEQSEDRGIILCNPAEFLAQAQGEMDCG